MDQETEEEGGKNRPRKFKSLNDKMFSLEGIWEQPPNPPASRRRRGQGAGSSARPAGAPPSALPPAFSGGAGLGNTHPFTPQTLTQVCLPPGSVEHAAWGECEGSAAGPDQLRQARTSTGYHALGQAHAGKGRAGIHGTEELLFHAWGGPGDREQVSTSVS